MSRSETVLSEDGTHIVTTHEGDVSIERTLAAMDREAALLAAHPGVRFVVFDYQTATMASQGTAEVRRAAAAARRVLDAYPGVTFIGVAPQQVDFGIARMFEQHVDATNTAGAGPSRTSLVRTMEEARSLMHRLGRAC